MPLSVHAHETLIGGGVGGGGDGGDTGGMGGSAGGAGGSGGAGGVAGGGGEGGGEGGEGGGGGERFRMPLHQLRKYEMRVYTPGAFTFAQPWPQLTMPTSMGEA